MLGTPSLDGALARGMEPRASAPAARLRTIRQLAEAGVPVRVAGPDHPGLNDHEIPAVLEAVKEATVGYVLLRLPHTVAPVILDWLKREQPDRAERIEGHIRATRAGKLNDGTFGRRMRGTGEGAEQIRQLFRLFVRKHGLDGDLPPAIALTSGRRGPRRGSYGCSDGRSTRKTM